MQYKQILFCDFNGVLSYNKYWNTISKPDHEYYNYHSRIVNYLFVDNTKLFEDWMIGRYTLEQIHEILSKKTGINYKFILKTFQKECRQLDVSEFLLKKIFSLKDKYYRILATGNMDSFNRYTLPANPFLTEVFNEINNSYDLGLLKNTDNGRYFSETCIRKNVPIKNCVLIDDSRDTCNIFTALGGKAYCATGTENISQVLDELTYLNNSNKFSNFS